MAGDDLAGVLFGGLVAAEPGVAGRGVEDPLGVIENEVVLGVFRAGELVQQFGAAAEAGADLTALAEPGPAACFLQDELNHGVAYSGELLSGAGVVDDVVVAAFGEGEPGGHLAGPRRQLAAAGLLAYLVGGLPGRLSGLAFAQVEVQAAEQQPQPASGHQQIAVLPQGESAAQELGQVFQPLPGSDAQFFGRCARVSPAQQVGRFLERFGSAFPDV